MGEMVLDDHGENWGEFCDDNDAFARVITFITLHQCTINLLFTFFSILIYQLS